MEWNGLQSALAAKNSEVSAGSDLKYLAIFHLGFTRFPSLSLFLIMKVGRISRIWLSKKKKNTLPGQVYNFCLFLKAWSGAEMRLQWGSDEPL